MPVTLTYHVDNTALNADIARIVTRWQELRTAIDAILGDLEGSSNG